MKCPYCASTETKVVDKRESADYQVTRRRRECLKCKKRFTTYERVEMTPLIVIKKNGNREQFDHGKLYRGILRSCEKRPIKHLVVEQLVDEVEGELRTKGREEVSSKQIGEYVMERLKNLDKVSYIRFASVYRDFADIRSFEREIGRLKKR